MVGKQDVLTDETARAILSHNEMWERVCSQATLKQRRILSQPFRMITAVAVICCVLCASLRLAFSEKPTKKLSKHSQFPRYVNSSITPPVIAIATNSVSAA